MEANIPTMNLDFKSYMGVPKDPKAYEFYMSDREAYLARVNQIVNGTTLHEFGHALGFIHEHLREEFVKLLGEDNVKENYRRAQGWDDEKIKADVLAPLKVDLASFSDFDSPSIMMYRLSKEDDGAPFDVPENNELSEEWARIV